MGERVPAWRRQIAALHPTANDVVGFGVGVILLLGAWAARNEAEGFATVLAIGGLTFVLLAIYNGILKSASIGPDGVSFERLHERDAAAEVAEAADVDQIVDEIDSDDQGPPSASEEDAEVIGSLNFIAGNAALAGVFDDMTRRGALRGLDVRLYLYDADLNALSTVFGTSDSTTTWPPGRGATGVAYATGEYVVAEGDAVRDATYGVTPEEGARYRDLTAVASAPVCNASGRVIGVLTAATNDATHSLGPGGQQCLDLTTGALLASRVLVELFQWFDDEP